MQSTLITAETATTLRFGNAHLTPGLRLHYAQQGQPSAEPTILLHGYSDSWYSFSRLLPHLPIEQFHVYALDQRGHGNSDRPQRGYGIEDLAGDVAAFMDAVGTDRATLIGHSLGSIVARRVVELHPDRIARLVLIGAAATPMNVETQGFLEVVQGLDDPVPTEFIRDFQASTVYAPIPEAFFGRVVAESQKLPAYVWRGVADGLAAADDAVQLGLIRVPTLLLWGEHDSYFPRDEQERLLAGIPDARLVVYPDSGHCPHWELPERVARDLEAFLLDA